MNIKSKDAIDLLKKDHQEVKLLFEKFQSLTDKSIVGKRKFATQICQALKLHTTLEEEIFYPAVRQSIDEQNVVDEALVEHAAAKNLITEIESMNPGDEFFDAKIKVLSEQIDHHVQEEEQVMFPKVQKSDLDLVSLAKDIKALKNEIRTYPL